MGKNPLYSSEAQFLRLSGAKGCRDDEVGRNAFGKDYARLLHAPSFRRLQGKTQLFPGNESDFFRNRLTHSLEVAQIAQGIAAKLNNREVPKAFPGGEINLDLVSFACIAHDLGHPPFGHNGEYALDEVMRPYGGFEGNAQTLHILASVERKLVVDSDGAFSSSYGIDLTYRSLASVLKYDSLIPAKRAKKEGLIKGYYSCDKHIVDAIKKKVAPKLASGRKFKTIECSIMDIADDIAYSTYDLEDSLHGGFITPLGMAYALSSSSVIQQSVMTKTNRALRSHGHAQVSSVSELLNVVQKVFGVRMPEVASASIDRGEVLNADMALELSVDAWRFDRALAEDGLARTSLTAKRVGALIDAVELVADKKYPQLSGVRMRREELLQVEVLKHLNYELVIRSARLSVVEHRGKDVIKKIFGAIEDSEGRLLPDDWREVYMATGRKKKDQMRVICDYVACMTDRYAAELYQRLFDEGPTIFKPL